MTTTKQPRPGSQAAKILELNAAGLTVRQIAEHLNTGGTTVRTQIKRLGHTPNPDHIGQRTQPPNIETPRPTTEENTTALWHYLDHRRQALQQELNYWKARAMQNNLTTADGTAKAETGDTK